MPIAIRITLSNGDVQYVKDEYCLTPDLQMARLCTSNQSAAGLNQRWNKFARQADHNYFGYLVGATVDPVDVTITLDA